MQLVDTIFDGGAGEDKGVAAAEAFNRLSGPGAPVLDPLGFVEHHNVGAQAEIDVERVGENLLVVDDRDVHSRGVPLSDSPGGIPVRASGILNWRGS